MLSNLDVGIGLIAFVGWGLWLAEVFAPPGQPRDARGRYVKR